MVKKQDSKYFYLLYPIILAIAFTILLVSLYPYRHPSSTQIINPTLTSAPKAAISWISYVDKFFNYQINYPNNWTKSDNYENIGKTDQRQVYLNGPIYSVGIGGSREKDLSLIDYLKRIDKISSTAFEGLPSKEIISSTNMVVNNVPAIQRQEKWLSAGFTTYVTYLLKDHNIITIIIIPYLGSDKPIDKQLYDEILQTLKFTN